ncbi:MAG: hypothetical protein LBC64_07585 [Fibromonadaceae bacterium]|jgi:hypothetical protein|nr:hypothetical protein [Fibromonadaceae bacterium]
MKPLHITKNFLIVDNAENKWLVLQNMYEHIYNRGAFSTYEDAIEFVKGEIKEPLNIRISFTQKETENEKEKL